jgi:hypothetical protein
MPAARCPDCLISYPPARRKCLVCGEPTDPLTDVKPDKDWRDEVNRRKWEAQAEGIEEATVVWRAEQLVLAGYTLAEARELATSTVDLHRACDLVRRCPHEQAYAILL